MANAPQFRCHTSLPFELFIAALTALPILILIYFYPLLPDKVPEYLNLQGEVEVWSRKGLMSVFRLPLLAIDLQVLCVLTKCAVWQGRPASFSEADAMAIYRTETFQRSMSLMDWFRAFIAIKLAASSLEVLFYSIEQLHFLTTATRAISWVTSILGVIGAIVYGYKLHRLNRKLKTSTLFKNNPRLNFRNKWVYVFIVCLLFLPLLMFGPMLNFWPNLVQY